MKANKYSTNHKRIVKKKVQKMILTIIIKGFCFIVQRLKSLFSFNCERKLVTVHPNISTNTQYISSAVTDHAVTIPLTLNHSSECCVFSNLFMFLSFICSC